MPEPRYFESSELTEKPYVLQNIPPDKITVLPDISPQPARVQLLINEQGAIDKVVIKDSDLSEQARQFVLDSFANVKFSPGKVGELSVKSQLQIEIILESARPAIARESVTIVH